MPQPKILTTDVVIMGGGGAGIAAGIEARDAGADVLILEKMSEPGGAAAVSGGGCCIVGTPLQESQGIKDTPDLAFDDWMKWGGPSADAVWARYYIEHTLHDLYHWAEANGVRWVDLKGQEGNSVLRWTRADDSGHGLMKALIASCQAKGAKLVTDATVTGLVHDGGRVVGVTAKTPEGPFEVRAKAVVIASGGFNSNIEMVYEAKPELKSGRVLEGSGFGATGDGHKLVRAEIGRAHV